MGTHTHTHIESTDTQPHRLLGILIKVRLLFAMAAGIQEPVLT